MVNVQKLKVMDIDVEIALNREVIIVGLIAKVKNIYKINVVKEEFPFFILFINYL